MATTMLNVPARTAAGQQLVSRQAIERGAGIEDLAVSDLMRQIATVIDTQLVTATGSAGSQGIVAIAQGTTYTDGSPTPDKLLPYLYQSESLLEKALLGRAVPDYVAMRSEHWNWICSQVSASHPWLAGQADQQRARLRFPANTVRCAVCFRMVSRCWWITTSARVPRLF